MNRDVKVHSVSTGQHAAPTFEFHKLKWLDKPKFVLNEYALATSKLGFAMSWGFDKVPLEFQRKKMVSKDGGS